MTDCNWNAPGIDPYRGPVAASVAAAVQRYNLPPADQAELVRKARMLQPDAIITIARDGMYSVDGTATDLRGMHHGKPGRVCSGPVVRGEWRDDQAETALVYCSGAECIAVPTICGNVARITWLPTAPSKEPEFRAWRGPPPETPATPRAGRPTPPRPVPEPSSLLLVAAALGVMVATRRPPPSRSARRRHLRLPAPASPASAAGK